MQVVSALLWVSGLVAAWASDDFAVPPPPPGFDAKRPLESEDLARKNDGGYVTGLPLANYDSNTGYGYGARAYYFWNGTRDDPFFAYTPYLHRVFLQAFFTTGGLQFHWLDYDVPSIASTPYRFRSQFIFVRNTNERYFGIGSRSLGPLQFPGSNKRFRSYAPYASELSQVRADGKTYALYDAYDLTRPLALLSLERTYFEGVLRPLVGFGFNYYSIRDYTGRSVNAVGGEGQSVRAPMASTRLYDDCHGPNPPAGCAGGWDNFLRLGVSFDTRDFEPDPNQGAFIDVAADIGTPLLGSAYSWQRLMISPRVYWSPMPEATDLVLALRGVLQVQSKSTPFFGMRLIPFTEDPRDGLGGLRTMRGYQQDRFVGPVMTLVNAEARWTFVRFKAFEQKFALIGVPFVDIGGAFDDLHEVALRRLRPTAGGALRMSWNLATIITVEYGRSREDSGLYVNFNHIF